MEESGQRKTILFDTVEDYLEALKKNPMELPSYRLTPEKMDRLDDELLKRKDESPEFLALLAFDEFSDGKVEMAEADFKLALERQSLIALPFLANCDATYPEGARVFSIGILSATKDGKNYLEWCLRNPSRDVEVMLYVYLRSAVPNRIPGLADLVFKAANDFPTLSEMLRHLFTLEYKEEEREAWISFGREGLRHAQPLLAIAIDALLLMSKDEDKKMAEENLRLLVKDEDKEVRNLANDILGYFLFQEGKKHEALSFFEKLPLEKRFANELKILADAGFYGWYDYGYHTRQSYEIYRAIYEEVPMVCGELSIYLSPFDPEERKERIHFTQYGYEKTKDPIFLSLEAETYILGERTEEGYRKAAHLMERFHKESGEGSPILSACIDLFGPEDVRDTKKGWELLDKAASNNDPFAHYIQALFHWYRVEKKACYKILLDLVRKGFQPALSAYLAFFFFRTGDDSISFQDFIPLIQEGMGKHYLPDIFLAYFLDAMRLLKKPKPEQEKFYAEWKKKCPPERFPFSKSFFRRFPTIQDLLVAMSNEERANETFIYVGKHLPPELLFVPEVREYLNRERMEKEGK